MPINRQEVGAHVQGRVIQFGVYLPQASAAAGFSVHVLVIHADDQFDPEIPTQELLLTFNAAHPLGLWSGSLDLSAPPSTPQGHFGNDGQYLYRFRLLRAGAIVTKVFLDPFATENGPGLLSAFRVGALPAFQWTDSQYITPPLDELIVYELNVSEFASTFSGVIDRLDYLEGLGVNCLSLMPVTPVKHEFDWGYGPIGYFAPEDYLGGPDGLKQLVDAAHARQIAVVLDVVYGHADAVAFPYAGVYDDAGLPNPMMQTPNRDQFGRGFEHSLDLTRQYCLEANKHWLDEYHVDGFRYDNVPGYYDGNPLQKYGTLVFDTYVYARGIARDRAVRRSSRFSEDPADRRGPKRSAGHPQTDIQQRHLARLAARQGRRHGPVGLRRRQLRTSARSVIRAQSVSR